MKIEVLEAEAARMQDWIATRGGVAVWQCLDVREAGKRVFAPALTTTGEPTTRPSWQYALEPLAVITDPADITTYTEVLFKAFPVALRQHGMTLKLSDAASRKLHLVMEQCIKAHGNAHYRKGVLPDKAASIGVYYSC